MPPVSIRGLIADTGFWIEAFDKSTAHHALAAAFLEDLREDVILMPWPITYEVMRTKTVQDSHMMRSFERVLTYRKLLRVDDRDYRDMCLREAFSTAARGRPISLVDLVVRAVIADTKYRITCLLTFNVGDFADVCHQRNVVIWPSPARKGGSRKPT